MSSPEISEAQSDQKVPLTKLDHFLRGTLVGTFVTGLIAIYIVNDMPIVEAMMGTNLPLLGCPVPKDDTITRVDSEIGNTRVINFRDPRIPHTDTKSELKDPRNWATSEEIRTWNKHDIANENGLTVFDNKKQREQLEKLVDIEDTSATNSAYQIAAEMMQKYGVVLRVPDLEPGMDVEGKTKFQNLSPEEHKAIRMALVSLAYTYEDKPKELIDLAGLIRINIQAIKQDKSDLVIMGEAAMLRGSYIIDPYVGGNINTLVDTNNHELGHLIDAMLCGNNRATEADFVFRSLNPTNFSYTGLDVPTSPIPPTLIDSAPNAMEDATVLINGNLKPNVRKKVRIDLANRVAHIAFRNPYDAKNRPEDFASNFELLLNQRNYQLIDVLGKSPLGKKTRFALARIAEKDPRIEKYYTELGKTIIKR